MSNEEEFYKNSIVGFIVASAFWILSGFITPFGFLNVVIFSFGMIFMIEYILWGNAWFKEKYYPRRRK